jgi:hypothetical protein
MSKRAVAKRVVTLTACLTLSIFASCMISWEIPGTPGPTASGGDRDSLHIPQNLLDDEATRDLALDCARIANHFARDSSQNHVWSIVFGAAQVVGAGVGTAATATAFSGSDGNDSLSRKVAAISFGIAAIATALDKAKEPGAMSDRQAASSFRIGALMLQASTVLNDDTKTLVKPPSKRPGKSAVREAAKEAAQRAAILLATCQDPKDVNMNTTRTELTQLLKDMQDAQVALSKVRAAADAGGDQGTPDGGAGGAGGQPVEGPALPLVPKG